MLPLDGLQFCALKLVGEIHMGVWIQSEISSIGGDNAFKD